MKTACKLEHLTVSYPSFTLQDVSLTLPRGCILGLVGENGAGKSTLIRALLNAIPREGGQTTVLDTDSEAPEFQQVKQQLGIVLDEACLPEMLTARELGRCFAAFYTNWDDAYYQELLKNYRLPTGKKFQSFSRGMKMKLAIALALAHHPTFLVLDEPTSGLDPMVREEILDSFLEFTRDEEHSILISSHIVSDLEKICDYVAFLHQGKLLFCEEKDALLERYALLQLGPAEVQDVPPEAICARRQTPYGVALLVLRDGVNPAFPLEKINLEQLILFLAKEDVQ